MSGATLLDGKALSSTLVESLASRIKDEQLAPHLHVITVGDDPGSKVYVKQKRTTAEKAGIIFSQTCLLANASLPELRSVIDQCNRDRNIHGVIVQLPLPDSLRAHEREVLNLVDPTKDVDCFHPENFGLLALGEASFLPATPAGILKILDHYAIETRGKRCVILGKSNIVGKPLALMLARESGPACTVIFCDQHTENVWELTRQADILIVAAGKHHLVRDPSVLRSDGEVAIIDVGIHRVQTAEGKTVVQGDVDAAALRPHCRWLTPVPGGVGPMTVACLLEQVVEAASNFSKPVAPLKRLLRGPDIRLTRAELVSLMRKIDPGFPASELQLVLDGMKAADDGTIGFHAFANWAMGALQSSSTASA